MAKPAAHQQSGGIMPRGINPQSGCASGISISVISAWSRIVKRTAPSGKCHQRRANQPIAKLGAKMNGLAKPLISSAKSPKIVMMRAPLACRSFEPIVAFGGREVHEATTGRGDANGDQSPDVSGRRRRRLLCHLVLRRSSRAV